MKNKHITIYDPEIFIGNFDDTTSLKSINTTNSTNFPQYTKAFVESVGQYFLDRSNVSSESLPNIVTPNTGTGRWILVPNSYHTKNILRNISSIDRNIITVGKRGCDFESIKDAIDSITDANVSNPYTINIDPGTYIEDTITMKEYVSVTGINTIIAINDPSKDLIIGSPNSSISDLQLMGSTDGKSLIVYEGGDGVFQVENVTFVDTYRYATINSNNGNCITLFTRCYGVPGNFGADTCFSITDNGSNITQIAIQHFIQSFFGTNEFTNFVEAHGNLTEVVINQNTIAKYGGDGIAINAYNGVDVRLNSSVFQGFDTVIQSTNAGNGPKITVLGSSATATTTYDINLLNPFTTGSINGSFVKDKVFIDSAITQLSLLYTDPENQGTVSVGAFYTGPNAANLTEIAAIIKTSPTMGVYHGGELSQGTSGSLYIHINSGFGYLISGTYPNSLLKKYEWVSQELLLANETSNYIFINSSGIITVDSAFPDTISNILLGRVVVDGAFGIIFIENTSMSGYHSQNSLDVFARKALGAIYENGSILSSNGSRQLSITAGTYFFSNTKLSPSAVSSPMSFTTYRSNGSSGWILNNDTIVDNNHYDSGTGGLTNLTTSYYARHSMYLVGDGTNAKHFLVYAQTQYSSQLLAEQGTLPTTPTYFDDSVVLIASFIVQQGSSSIIEIIDERPIIGFKAAGISASSDHGNLLGLSDDDHTQYLLVSGARSMGGNLDMGGNNITNVGNVDGVDVSAHASRHLPNGADPLATASPTANLGGSSTNGIGIQNSYSRSDHSHAIDKADSGTTGLLKSSDWLIFNNKINNVSINGSSGTNFTLTTSNITEGTNFYYLDSRARASISSTTPLNYNSTSGILSIFQATSTSGGYLSNVDWSTFNSKQSAITTGNLTEATSSILTITGGTGSVIGSGLTIQVKQAQNGTSGYLSSTDWTTFNNKINSVIINGSSGTNFTLNTSAISEGTNFYYLDSRARTSISTTSPLGYNSASGVISIFQSSSTSGGYLSQTDWNTFNSKQNTLPNASATTSGILTSTDWTTFNNKINSVIINGSNGTNFTLTTSNITEGTNFYYLDSRARASISGGAPLSYNSTTGAMTIFQSTSTSGGYLSQTDWNTFNNKYSTAGGIIYGNALRDTTGYTTSGAAMLGFTGTGTSRLTFDGTNGSNGIQYSISSGSALQMYSYNSIILQGNRNVASTPSFVAKSDTGVYIDYRSAKAASTAMSIEIDNTQTGDILKLLNNNTTVSRFTSSGILQLNTTLLTAPNIPNEAILHLVGNSNTTYEGIITDVYGSNGGYSTLRKARGTAAAPTALQTGDVLGQYAFDGYGTSGFSTSSLAFVSATANQTFTNANKGTYMSFYTTSDNTVTATERMKILATGDVEMLSTGYVRIPIGTTAQRPSSTTSGYIRYNTSVLAYEAMDGTAWGHLGHLVPVQFSLLPQLNNSATSFYYSKDETGVTNAKVSVDTGNGLSANAIDPWLAPFNGRIVGAVMYAKGLGVANGTPTGPYTYRADIYNNTATATLLSTMNFSYPNGTTIGSFSSAVSTYAVTELTGLNINITKGMNLGLRWVPATGAAASSITVQEGVRVTLLVQKTY